MMAPGEPIVEGIEAAKRWAEAMFAGATGREALTFQDGAT